MSSSSFPPPSKASKLIFAPGDNSNPSDSQTSRAAQFNIGTLHRTDLDSDPFKQFHSWFSDPRLIGHVPETVCLSTAELPSGRVSSRMVYLKELDERGFVVYSNFGTSRKASDLATNPFASLTFWHKPTERQIRIEGTTERLADAESQVYFNTRARGSRIGAWASRQSSVLPPTVSNPETTAKESEKDDGRALLDSQVDEISQRFPAPSSPGTHDEIPVPSFWGGLRVIPDLIEFWQGRESRLHDRFRYTLVSEVEGGGEKKWKIERLSP